MVAGEADPDGTEELVEASCGCNLDVTGTTGDAGGVIGTSDGATTRTPVAIGASSSTTTTFSG